MNADNEAAEKSPLKIKGRHWPMHLRWEKERWPAGTEWMKVGGKRRITKTSLIRTGRRNSGELGGAEGRSAHSYLMTGAKGPTRGNHTVGRRSQQSPVETRTRLGKVSAIAKKREGGKKRRGVFRGDEGGGEDGHRTADEQKPQSAQTATKRKRLSGKERRHQGVAQQKGLVKKLKLWNPPGIKSPSGWTPLQEEGMRMGPQAPRTRRTPTG